MVNLELTDEEAAAIKLLVGGSCSGNLMYPERVVKAPRMQQVCFNLNKRLHELGVYATGMDSKGPCHVPHPLDCPVLTVDTPPEKQDKVLDQIKEHDRRFALAVSQNASCNPRK